MRGRSPNRGAPCQHCWRIEYPGFVRPPVRMDDRLAYELVPCPDCGGTMRVSDIGRELPEAVSALERTGQAHGDVTGRRAPDSRAEYWHPPP